jgi:hypothetical protein
VSAAEHGTYGDGDPRDVLAVDLLDAIGDLAVIVRERNPTAIRRQLHQVLALGGDRAALVVAAAMIPTDQPVDPWWTEPDPTAENNRARLAAALGIDDDYRRGVA